MYLAKIKQILTNPNKFFSSLKEKTLQDALLYFIILSAFSAFMTYIMMLLFGDSFTRMIVNFFNLNTPIPDFNSVTLLGQTILGYIFTIAASFVVAGILYLWLLLFGGNKGYNKTYQLYTYSQTPTLLFKWIPIVGMFASIYSFILLVIGTRNTYNFSTLKSTLIYLIPLFFLFVIALILALGTLAFLNFNSLA